MDKSELDTMSLDDLLDELCMAQCDVGRWWGKRNKPDGLHARASAARRALEHRLVRAEALLEAVQVVLSDDHHARIAADIRKHVRMAKCQACGEWFKARRSDARACSPKCQKRIQRARKLD